MGDSGLRHPPDMSTGTSPLFRARPWCVRASVWVAAWLGAGASGMPADLAEGTTRVHGELLQAAEQCVTAGQSPPKLHRSEQLDEAARLVQLGLPLGQALQSARFPALQASHLTLTGWRDVSQLVPAALPGICQEVARLPSAQWGLYAQAPQAVIVAAVPWRAQVGDAREVQREVLKLTNEARSRGRQCGERHYARARALLEDPKLHAAATEHASDLAKLGLSSHVGSDGREAGQRLRDAGYRWRSVGENIATGQPSAASVVQAWLNSPQHCANLMNPGFRHMGVAFVIDPERRPRIYWVQKFGTPP